MVRSRSSRTAYMVKEAYRLWEAGHSKERIVEELELISTVNGKWSGLNPEDRIKKLQDIATYVISKKSSISMEEIIEVAVREIVSRNIIANTAVKSKIVYDLCDYIKQILEDQATELKIEQESKLDEED